MVALGTAVERRRVDAVSGGPQAIHDRLPDPAPLIRAVNEHIRRHDHSLYRAQPRDGEAATRSVHGGGSLRYSPRRAGRRCGTRGTGAVGVERTTRHAFVAPQRLGSIWVR